MCVHVVGLEEEVELEVDEAKTVELLIVGLAELVDDDAELGEGDADEVLEAIETVAWLGRGERGNVSSGGRSGSRSGSHGRSVDGNSGHNCNVQDINIRNDFNFFLE